MPSVKEQTDAARAALDKWERDIGLPAIKLDFDEVDKVLNMSRGVLNDLSAREASENAFVLAQAAMAIQRRENQIRAFLQWADANRTRLDGEGQRQLRAYVEIAQQRLARVAYVGRRIEFTAQCLHNLQRTKQREEGQ